MSTTTENLNLNMKSFLIYASIIFILTLTSINIKNYLSPKKVLGIQTQSGDLETFWKEFVNKNPDYIPGWIEIGGINKIKEIDPNYLTP